MIAGEPLVSVIMPVYNGEAFLEEAVNNLRSQDYANMEIILVDDGSTDSTAKIAAGLSGNIKYIRQSNQGPAAARNAGIKAASGDFIGFLDVDDLWPANKLRDQLIHLEQKPSLGGSMGLIQSFILKPGEKKQELRFEKFSKEFKGFFLGSCLFRRNVFDEVGRFDPSMPSAEDVDWFLRAKKAGVQIADFGQVTLFYRIHQANMSRDGSARISHFIRALKKSLDRDKVSTGSLNPLVSVVVPVYNGEHYLAETLESVFKQTYRPFEVIVVNDGSTDKSEDIALSFKGINYIKQSNQGVAAARNAGIAASRGEFIAFLDQDDLWLAAKLSRQVEYLQKHPATEYVLTKQKIFFKKGLSRPHWLREGFLEEEQVGFLPGTLLARKTLFQKIGDFNTHYVTASDSEWFFRARDAGIGMAIIPEALLHKRIHGDNQSSQTKTANEELLRAVKASIDRKSKQRKSISVIIPAYNAGLYLEEALQSVLAQEYRPTEVIVVDDGSTDETAKVAQGFGDSVRYVFQKNAGAPIARNRGVELAQGDLLAFLDADDLWMPDKLKKQVDAFKADPDLDMVFGHVQQFLAPGADARLLNRAHEILPGYVVGTMLIKRSSFLKAGWFSNEWRVGDILDWHSRATACGLKSRMLSEVVMRRRIHTDNMGIRERAHQTAEYLKVIKMNLDRKRKMST